MPACDGLSITILTRLAGIAVKGNRQRHRNYHTKNPQQLCLTATAKNPSTELE
jgi:hypothetical protein